MAKGTKDGSEPPRNRKTAAAQPAVDSPPLTRAQRARQYTRSVIAKATHDTAAHYVKRAFIAVIGLVFATGTYHFYGQDYDFPAWLPPRKPRLETGSITKTAPKNEGRKRLEAECVAQKAKDISALTQLRQSAFAAYETCLTQYRQTWASDPTPKQFCAPKLTEHIKRRQDVLDREAKGCAIAGKQL